MEEVTVSLETPLHSNRQLQAKIALHVYRILQEKAENRRVASQVAAHLSCAWEMLQQAEEPLRPARKLPKRASTSPSESVGQGRKSHLKRKWRYDPYRKWMLRFFTDPDGGIPLSNEDTTRRRSLEQGKPSHSTSPPWSKEEEDALGLIVSRVRTRSIPSSSEIDEGAKTEAHAGIKDVDFAEVAELLNARGDFVSSHRSGTECRVKFMQSVSAAWFSKEESCHLLGIVERNDESWDQIPHSLETNRTPWQCFAAYQSNLSGSTHWSPDEDELLVKYTAAMGPQWVFHVGAAAQMSLQLIPDKSPKQILARAHASLVNPNYVHDVWSNDEERKLALCMKVYRDESSPLVKVTAHFQNRASKSVSEKWNRSLDPDLSSKPFDSEEDNKLLRAVRSSGRLDWNILSQQFPGRHPRSLANRWAELASHADFMELCAQQGIVNNADGGTDLSALRVRAKRGTKPHTND